MTKVTKISFSALKKAQTGVVVILTDSSLAFGAVASETLADMTGGIERAARIAGFEGKKSSVLDLIAPAGLELDRVILVGLGQPSEMNEEDWVSLGGTVQGALKNASADKATLIAEYAGEEEGVAAQQAAAMALGAVLRSYDFTRYKSPKKEDKAAAKLALSICATDHKAAKKAWTRLNPVAEGVCLSRDLMNEPANILGTEEFAAKAQELEKLGAEVEILTEKEMKKLGMNALLGVSQGSVRPPRLAIMRWNGGKKNEAPIAFVGKGVVFDTGGISIKPAAGMEDMKGDMGGAAVVTGLMHTLAARKAKVNVVGVIGIVENMPDGAAQRPGDIVTAMSGTTIEILNTDAEGRLVLADALWYTQERFKPVAMIDLATLTGAMIIALGYLTAGLFTNTDELAEQIGKAGLATGETVWRMPLSAGYDKMVDTPNADIRNTGGSRAAGSITAAQFLQRFTNDVPWVHLDIAGTASGAPKTEISQGWASGFGVRLLDRFVADTYEA